LRLIPVGQAHTEGSPIIEVAEDRVAYAGDVLYGGRLLAVLPVSRVSGWIDAFDRLRTLPGGVFVPGHGAPGRLADFEHPTYAYLTTLKSQMDTAVASGTDINDAIASLDQSPWQGSELAGRNAHLSYLEAEDAAFQCEARNPRTTISRAPTEIAARASGAAAHGPWVQCTW
jgi:glyoxylase-like metal-dependent hydrolase (beta-lactamase superfamily II)